MGDTSSNEAWDAEDLPKHVDRARRLGFEEVGYFFHYVLLLWVAPLYILWGGGDWLRTVPCSHQCCFIWNFWRCGQKEWKPSSWESKRFVWKGLIYFLKRKFVSKIFWRPRKSSFKVNIALKVFGQHWVLLSLEEVASLMEEVKLEANNHLENYATQTHNVHCFS